MLSFGNVASGILAANLADKLGPVTPVSFWPDLLCAALSCIITVTSLLMMGLSQGIDEKQPDGKTVRSSPMKGWMVAMGVGAFLAIFVGAGLHQFRWNMYNPQYYAATSGIDAIQNAIRY